MDASAGRQEILAAANLPELEAGVDLERHLIAEEAAILRAGTRAGDEEALAHLSRSPGLVAEREHLLVAADERAAKVAALTRLLGSLNTTAPPEEVARTFASEVRQYLGADGVMVYAFDHETGDRVQIALDSALTGPSMAKRVALAESVGFRAMARDPLALFDAGRPEAAPAWLGQIAQETGFGSVIAVRLDSNGEAVGMIAAGCAAPGVLGASEADLLAAVATPLAMVIERARVVTSLRQQTQRTQAVLDILAALGLQDTLEEVASPVASALRTMYNADHCTIGSIEAGVATLMGIDSDVVDWQPGAEYPAPGLRLGEPEDATIVHVIGDLARADAGLTETSRAAASRGMRSSMRVTIGSPADPLGVVTVGSREANRYTERDARELARIVQPLGVAARYFRGRREALRRTKRLEFSNRVLTRLSAGGTAEHLVAGFLAECRALFGSPHAAALAFHHAEGTAHLLGLDSDVVSREALAAELPLAEMYSSRLSEQATPNLVVDAREAAGAEAHHAPLIAAGLYSAIDAPLMLGDSVSGVVSIWGEGVGRFTAEDSELVSSLARPLGIALEKAAALDSLGERELKYRSLVSQAEEMIYLYDSQTRRVLDANGYTARALGYTLEELLRLRLDDIAGCDAQDLAADAAAILEYGELRATDRAYRRSDGATLDVDIVASLVAFGGRQEVLVLARDVSEHKALERQLVQSQKMESLGAMAGAVAHDFNNLLTTILGFAGLLKRSPNMDEEERENLGLIEDAARRAADLTGRLLSFSRGGLVRFGPVDLREVTRDTLRLAEATMHAGLEVVTELPGAPIYVEGDAGQLQQSMTNIVLNARDAMPEGGRITVRLGTDGTSATITIADNGPGMDAETRTRIFEPFYTTKPAGSGTGLGMAITYGIIQGHHGDVAVESAKGRGTTFTITLPLLAAGASNPHIEAFNAGEGNLVLVVDDDEMVRRATTATLAELGYNVVEAPGGATAVEIVRARPDRFSAVLLDLVMPGMTGSETFRALTAIRGDLPVIVCTGYAADAHIDTDVKRRIAGLVQKPFSAERLAKALLVVGAKPTRVRR